MKVTVHKDSENNAWTITAGEGPLAGRVIGVAENIGLGNATLNADGSISADYIAAVFGAVFVDEVWDYPKIVRKLGINQGFLPANDSLAYDYERGWYDVKTGKTRATIVRLSLSHDNVYYDKRLEDQSCVQALLDTTDPILLPASNQAPLTYIAHRAGYPRKGVPQMDSEIKIKLSSPTSPLGPSIPLTTRPEPKSSNLSMPTDDVGVRGLLRSLVPRALLRR